MPSTTNADGTSDGTSGGGDAAVRLSQMSNRTNLMVIDATLNVLPKEGEGYAAAAAEMRVLARRMRQAVADIAEALEPMREPAA